ncbi:sialate O-acetylesterase [Rariglobus hedericola]|uniref:Sialate O-acetylesterase n=1 Tax=Rariglobus hedericola TaxID=2597822 RepID=A0A556QST8_9BACT|nr:sialate O-acetylesterase [Rariglobus hedericola]TSJ79683.1 sialate O-acetylesterase [Rariglobus hedericola]
MKILQGLSEGQVVQRIGRKGATVRLSGESAEVAPVLATIEGARGALKGWKARRVGTAGRGRFSAELAGVPAGGPYRLTLRCGAEQVRVKEFYAGDVWLMAGQSNMEGVGDMSAPVKPHPLIRVLTMRREWRLAKDPLHVLGESPDSCHAGARQLTREQAESIRTTTKRGVGVGVFFAREMLERSGVPQGLIATAHGGTTMEQWNPALKDRGGDSLYGSMMLSCRETGQPVAGVLWYQGESDAGGPPVAVYTEKMRALVAAVRRDLKQPALPWVIVQLATVFGSLEDGAGWNSIQEQQRLLALKVKQLETVAAVDLPLDDNIHIGAAGFPVLANRMARAADRLVYGNCAEVPMPRLKTIISPDPKKAPGQIDVVFEHVPGGLRAAGAARGFTLVDGDGKVLPSIFKTTLHGDTARLHMLKGLVLPWNTRLAYGHGRMPVCTITDGRGCALPVFAPQPFMKPNAMAPFFTTWRVSPVVTAPAVSLAELACPHLDGAGSEVRSYGMDGFINEHARWQKAEGHGYFAAKLTLAEAMKLEFLLGYDGPFRMWIDGKPFYTDIGGINPCLADEFSKTTTLPAGEHTLTVAMDLACGASWGFFLRLCRRDLSAAEVRKGQFARPAYSV